MYIQKCSLSGNTVKCMFATIGNNSAQMSLLYMSVGAASETSLTWCPRGELN